jgi:ADP-ribose pyrophosphatase
MRIVPEDAILIPEQAHRMFEGVIFDVYHWPQQMFDGSTRTFEMLRRLDTVIAICIQGDKIVTLREQQPRRPYYEKFAGGRVERGEAWEVAARRETKEELGQEYGSWRLIDVVQPEHKIEWFVATYIASDFTGEVTDHSEAGGERIEIREYSFDELKALIASGEHQMLSYAKPVFDRANSLEELKNLPVFKGKEIA